jgi:hypothetical protein
MPLSEKTEPDKESGSAQSTSSGPRMISVAGHKIDSRELFIGTREVVILPAAPDQPEQADPDQVTPPRAATPRTDRRRCAHYSAA